MSTTSIGRASAILASGTIVSRVLGFVRTALLSVVIGNVGFVADAYLSATYVPNSIYAIIGGGLLTAVLVPQIIRASSGPDRGQAYVNKVVTIAVCVFALVTVVVTVLSPPLMAAFVTKPATLAIAITFAYWSLPQLFFLGLYSVLGEVLNARRSFGPYTWAPVLNNVVSIAMLGLFVVLFGTVDPASTRPFSLGMDAVLAGGATLGIAAQALVLILAWRRAGLGYRPDFSWRGVNLSSTGRAAGWTFGMLVLTQLSGLIEMRVATIASGVDASSAVMSYAWLIFMLPHSIITVSLVTVFYPRMSEHAAEGDTAALRDDVGQALRIVLLVLVVADAALLVAALPFSAFFSHSLHATGAMALVVAAYLVGLLPFTALFVIQRCFYALADTRTPFGFTLVQLVVAVTGTLLCALLPHAYIAAGIALSVSVSTVVQLVVAAVLLRRRIGGFAGRAVRGAIARYLIAAVPALAVGLLLLAVLGGFSGGWAVSGRLDGLVATAVLGAVVAGVYLGVLAVLRAPELGTAVRLVTARFRPSRAAE
ncbi:murein biosynthesis integral membrane protein MurJ [Amnibacterium sp. CER49]|uniref:murein biosynthesis integral membrane protein MurJ n=1 Tax=Amnibacterium sp. CER49 TaxID=3039161 RepID=UPI002448AFDC|nr:murein biosynthesis integral membrane protein MurJ [Amnibacterium sp. CER49]MDH2443637.1 murein biosynthesis integral membrane protein MurJ [Amnibacterium sp. CER49]